VRLIYVNMRAILRLSVSATHHHAYCWTPSRLLIPAGRASRVWRYQLRDVPVMSRQPMARMDIDTRWAYHRKCRALQSRFPRKWPAYWCAYMALLGESWVSQQRVTLDDAWLPTLHPVKVDEARRALMDVGLIDADGYIPDDSWTEWALPAFARIKAKSEGGKKGAAIRHGRDIPSDDGEPDQWESLGIPTADPRHVDAPSQPASQPSHPRPASHPTTPGDSGYTGSTSLVDARPLKAVGSTR
jgi:hypothetical protein